MGKALGSMGGFIAGSADLIAYLTSTARSLMYSTALPPASCAAAGAALGIIRSEPERRERLRAVSLTLIRELGKRGLDTGDSASHIVPVMAPGDGIALGLARRLEARGYLARAIRYPTVAHGAERLRLSLRCDFNENQMRELAAAIAEEGSHLGLAGGRANGPIED
jgi:7-keto-8-aminopelargonate synthetase-like enzyme